MSQGFAGLVGIGGQEIKVAGLHGARLCAGGLIFSPFFLLMGVDPSVAVATSSTCVFDCKVKRR